MALTQAPMLSAIAPFIASQQRATFLSIQSLAGRLGFSITLYGLASLTNRLNGGTEALSWPQLSILLRASFVFAIAALFIIYWTSRRLETHQSR